MLLAAHLKSGVSADEVSPAVKNAWQLADAGLELERLPKQNVLELRSRRVFMDESIGAEALKAGEKAQGVLAYFVNEIRLGDKATPYSIVAATGDRGWPRPT